MESQSLCNQYRSLLLDGIVPFWFRQIDWDHGGILSCLTEDGAVKSTDKFLWSQARSVWTFAALYNRIENRPEFLEAARNSIRFLLERGRDQNGDWVYQTSRTGEVLEGAISIYTDCFVVYGLSEYCRADPDPSLLLLARRSYERIRERIAAPGFNATAPYKLPLGRRVHAIPMLLTEVTSELAQTIGDAELEHLADEYAAEVLTRFVRPDRKLLLEFLSEDYQELPPNEGTLVIPGHAIESMWFMLRLGRRRGDLELASRAAEVMRWHLEAGWDQVYGGLFLGIDAEGNPPFLSHPEKKLWWPHTEALYGLLLAHHLTGDPWCLAWYEKVHDWAFRHFSMPETGEWLQRLDRRGKPVTETVALPVKDPFHLPRACILIIELLSGKAKELSR